MQVHEAIDAAGQTVAVKSAKQGDAHAEGLLAAEAKLHAKLQHPNVVALRGIVDAPGLRKGAIFATDQSLVLEYCEGGTLEEVMRRYDDQFEDVPEGTRLDALDGVLAALEHVHERGVCHLDVKPENVLLKHSDASGLPQQFLLADFGLAHAADGQVMMPLGPRGTKPYIAPELALNERNVASPAADIWSVGVLMRALLDASEPYGYSSYEVFIEDLQTGTAFAEERAEPQGQYGKVMAACLNFEPALRPSASAVRDGLRKLREALR